MPNPTAAILIIGDEILSGRTRDSNMNFLARTLSRNGFDLVEARFVADRHDDIVTAVNALRARVDHLFTSGGIGPTHDDITADAIAAAFEASIDIREDARALLAAHYARIGSGFTPERQRMARIPEGAGLIENPVTAAPGFSLGNVHVMAGVPAVFEGMVASLLPRLTGGRPVLSQSWRILRSEGEVAAPLAELAQEYDDLSIGSYPFQHDGVFGTNVVIRGEDGARVAEAVTQLAELFPADGGAGP